MQEKHEASHLTHIKKKNKCLYQFYSASLLFSKDRLSMGI